MEFTDWITFEEIATAPATHGVFQIRIDQGLFDYPTGKSAMFYYGYGNNLNLNLSEFQKAILPLLSIFEKDLLVRWLPDRNAKSRFEQRMDAFVNKFSSMPLGNEEWLKQVNKR